MLLLGITFGIWGAALYQNFDASGTAAIANGFGSVVVVLGTLAVTGVLKRWCIAVRERIKPLWTPPPEEQDETPHPPHEQEETRKPLAEWLDPAWVHRGNGEDDLHHKLLDDVIQENSAGGEKGKKASLD